LTRPSTKRIPAKSMDGRVKPAMTIFGGREECFLSRVDQHEL
jgi:hypothetical protein